MNSVQDDRVEAIPTPATAYEMQLSVRVPRHSCAKSSFVQDLTSGNMPQLRDNTIKPPMSRDFCKASWRLLGERAPNIENFGGDVDCLLSLSSTQFGHRQPSAQRLDSARELLTDWNPHFLQSLISLCRLKLELLMPK